MPDEVPNVDRFIQEQIDSVPHLEALLFLWRNAPQRFSSAELAEKLYIAVAQAAAIADDLHRVGLIARDPGANDPFFYDPGDESRNRLLEAVDATYRRELIRISGIIHSKVSPGIRAFADAFRFRKDKP
jgi:DNA-binding MarR family transcriptional regulator